MTTTLTTTPTNPMQLAGAIANAHAAKATFAEFKSRKADNTNKRHATDLAKFADYLAAMAPNMAPTGEELLTNPAKWQGVTFGIVEGFAKWQLQEGFAIGTVNLRLSTVKRFCTLAFKAGHIDATEHALIRTVVGYSRKEGKRIDATRATTRTKRAKKDKAVTLTPEDIAQLKTQPNTPQGRRDALLIGLLTNLGLRVGEVVGLEVANVNITAGTLTFYRPKVDKTQTHRLTNGLWKAIKNYFDAGDVLTTPQAPLLRASVKGGALAHGGMTRFGIAQRVRALGEAVGIDNLSPHDLRHYWATNAANNGTPLEVLQEAGGWDSYIMPLRYITAAKVSNDGIKQGDDNE